MILIWSVLEYQCARAFVISCFKALIPTYVFIPIFFNALAHLSKHRQKHTRRSFMYVCAYVCARRILEILQLMKNRRIYNHMRQKLILYTI